MQFDLDLQMLKVFQLSLHHRSYFLSKSLCIWDAWLSSKLELSFCTISSFASLLINFSLIKLKMEICKKFYSLTFCRLLPSAFSFSFSSFIFSTIGVRNSFVASFTSAKLSIIFSRYSKLAELIIHKLIKAFYTFHIVKRIVLRNFRSPRFFDWLGVVAT